MAQIIQNQPRIEPPTNPIPKDTVMRLMTIAAVSASKKGTDLGVRIMMTLLRYPLVTPSMNLRPTTGVSVFSHLGPWRG